MPAISPIRPGGAVPSVPVMAAPPSPDLRPSYLEHRAIRVDAARLTDLLAAARPVDADRLTALSAWYVRYETAIDHHHRAEEAVIYPALLARDPSFAEADAELENEHRVLIDRLAVVRESLGALPAAAGGSRWEREHADAVTAARALRAIVETHLEHEEATAFPRYAAAFTGSEFDELGKAVWKLVGVASVIFAGPWVLDHATPAERADMLAAQPLLMRLAYRLALRPRFDRLASPLRAPATPVTHPEG
jgi:hemerythrin-like domain-containing protein